mgnify:CR=1 FL=1
MFNPIKPSTPSLKDALTGIAIAMVICYLLYSAQDLLRGEFYPNFLLIRNLLLMGVGVLIFGMWEQWRTS